MPALKHLDNCPNQWPTCINVLPRRELGHTGRVKRNSYYATLALTEGLIGSGLDLLTCPRGGLPLGSHPGVPPNGTIPLGLIHLSSRLFYSQKVLELFYLCAGFLISKKRL